MSSGNDNLTLFEQRLSNYQKKTNKISGSTSEFQARRGMYSSLFFDDLSQMCISQFKTTAKDTKQNLDFAFEGFESLLFNGFPVPVGWDGNGEFRIFDPMTNVNPLLVTGSGSMGAKIDDPVSGRELVAINPRTGEGDFVIITNKNIRALMPFIGSGAEDQAAKNRLDYARMSDVPLVQTFANEMAIIWATSLQNTDMMRTPYILATTSNNLTSTVFYEKFVIGGDKVINLDGRESPDELIKLLDLKVPDFTPALRAQMDDAMGRLLELRGIFYDDNSKGERMLAREAGGGAQAIQLFNLSRLQVRRNKFEILMNSKKGKETGLKIKCDNSSIAYKVLAMEESVPDVDKAVGDGTYD